MAEFSVIEGRLSEYYNHFRDYRFTFCEATDTRLLGVIAMRICWTDPHDSMIKYYQVLHLDYSEYGIDDYFEFDCNPDYEEFRYYESVEKMRAQWNHFIRVMGGNVVKLPLEVMMSLIDEALPLTAADIDREYDSPELEKFRADAVSRIELMREALKERGSFRDTYSYEQITDMVSPGSRATCETINYFLMRLVDRDYRAAAFLSTIDEQELADNEFAAYGIQTLMKNSIRKADDVTSTEIEERGYPYYCNIVTLNISNYYYATATVYLSGDYRKRNCKVTGIDVSSIICLSDYEAAMQIRQSEYITVFDCRDRLLGHFDGSRLSYLDGLDPTLVPNGWLYTVYSKDNSYVNKAEYRMNDDVYGYAILTIDGEYVLMSNKLNAIERMDDSTMTSLYAPFMKLTGRYRIDTPIFHDFCMSRGIMFRSLLDQPEYGD